MDKAEYERIKEAEKAHLRSLKKLKEAVRHLERQRNVSQALENMATGSQKTFDEQAELVDRLALETAQNEARLDVALDAAKDAEADAQAAARADEEMEQLRAQELVRQMKLQMGVPEPGSGARREAVPDTKPEKTPPSPPASDDPSPPPEKTIGRMR